jgi:outer membrane protein assembly factor BamD (BamD/ComL family)
MAIGIYQLRRGDYADAIAHYRVVTQDKKGKPSALRDAYVGMAKAYRALGETALEQECLEAAKQLRQ